MSNVFGNSVRGILADRAADVYEFDADSPGEIRLSLTHPAGPVTNGQAIRLRLVNADNKQIAVLTANGNDELIATVSSKGHYFLFVEDADARINTPAAYTVASTLTYDPKITYEGEPNDTSSTPQPVSLDIPIHGRLENGDTDYFKISSDTGGVLTLRFTHPHGQGNGGRAIDVTVTDKAGNTVTREQLKGDATLVTTVAGAGDYFVSVKDVFSGETNDRGLYHLTPSLDHYPKVVYDGPVNNSPATALALPLGATAIGDLEPNDVDYYKIEASSGGTLSMNFLHPHGPGKSGSYIGITILDDNKQIVTKAEHGNDLFTTELANGGTYYVGIADTLNRVEPGLYKFMLGLTSNGGKIIDGSAAAPYAGTGGNDVVHGSSGRDTMLYQGSAAGYAIEVSPAGASVRDTAGVEGSDTLFNVERLRFADKAVALDVDGSGGGLLRLYQAAFDRAPDEAGFGFWLHHLDGGVQMHTLSAAFIDSKEFTHLYGPNPGNAKFIEALYDNVLHRDYDQAGFDYWLRVLDQDKIDRPDILIEFANSAENAAQVVGSMLHGIVYEPWMNS